VVHVLWRAEGAYEGTGNEGAGGWRRETKEEERSERGGRWAVGAGEKARKGGKGATKLEIDATGAKRRKNDV
jgi:hypothetical protein